MPMRYPPVGGIHPAAVYAQILVPPFRLFVMNPPALSIFQEQPSVLGVQTHMVPACSAHLVFCVPG